MAPRRANQNSSSSVSIGTSTMKIAARGLAPYSLAIMKSKAKRKPKTKIIKLRKGIARKSNSSTLTTTLTQWDLRVKRLTAVIKRTSLCGPARSSHRCTCGGERATPSSPSAASPKACGRAPSLTAGARTSSCDGAGLDSCGKCKISTAKP